MQVNQGIADFLIYTSGPQYNTLHQDIRLTIAMRERACTDDAPCTAPGTRLGGFHQTITNSLRLAVPSTWPHTAPTPSWKPPSRKLLRLGPLHISWLKPFVQALLGSPLLLRWPLWVASANLRMHVLPTHLRWLNPTHVLAMATLN